MKAKRLSVTLACLAFGLALVVVPLGAFVRLSDAGLGCPDWPGCYGQMVVPEAQGTIAKADAAYPNRPLHAAKAWKEMIHRYAAGTLGLLVLALAIVAWRRRREPDRLLAVPTILLVLVIFQALLGMWTVTLLLKPIVVTAHLLGGMTTLMLLWWVVLRESRMFGGPTPGTMAASSRLFPWVVVAIAVVYLQIFLGGWTSSNYAQLVCPDFPTCRGGMWWPPMNFSEGFTLWRGLGINYEYGVLDLAGRTAIHMAHRMGALLVVLVVGTLALRAVMQPEKRVRRVGIALFLVLLIQVSLGIANVELRLPLPVAVSHNAGAAVLLLTVITMLHVLRPPRAGPAAATTKS